MRGINDEKVTPIEVQKYLSGVEYPAKKEDLLKAAQENDANQDVFDLLNELPDKEYLSPADISKEIGKEERE